MAAIEVDHLRRVYRTTIGTFRRRPKEVVAVDDISFEVYPGELFGLLGPNGAGKTTTVKMLTTLLTPTAGTARIMGYDIVRDENKVRPIIGFIYGGERGLYWRLSARDNLHYFADLYHVEPAVAKKRIPELLEIVGLKGREEERVEGYSRGMRQRLHIARALLHDPQVLFLDEPTLGLDPVGARELRSMIRELSAQGKTVLLTTHYMFEADALCARIAVINHGRIIALDTPAALKKYAQDLSVVEVEVFGIEPTTLEEIRGLPAVEAVSLENLDQRQVVLVQSGRGSEVVPSLMQVLSGVRVGKVVVREPTLEDAYVRLVGGEKGIAQVD